MRIRVPSKKTLPQYLHMDLTAVATVHIGRNTEQISEQPSVKPSNVAEAVTLLTCIWVVW
jgi:hypothetical protein